MSNEITEAMIEEYELLSYDKWLEGVWDNDFWWDWILDEFVEDCAKDGISIDSGGTGKNIHHNISFDIYRRQCASDGRITSNIMFYEEYKDQLLAESLVFTQMFLDGYIYVTWGESTRGWLSLNVEIEYFGDADVFKSGLLAGTSVEEMYELEKDNLENFETCIKNIIEGLHSDLLERLESAYEYDSSYERYEEWIQEEISMLKSSSPTNS